MGVITKKDLSIFRGTFDECKNSWNKYGVENMRIYLAWDTHEIFVGNSSGQAIPYGVPKILYNRIDERIKEIENGLENILKPIAEDKISEIVPEIVEEKAGALVASEITNALINYYTKNEIDSSLSHINKAFKEYSTKTEVAELTNSLQNNISTINSTIETLAKKDEIPKKVSELENDAGYLTKHQSLEGYATVEYVDNAISASGLTAEQLALLKEIAETGIQNLITKDDADSKYQPKGNYLTQNDISGFATIEYVNEKTVNINIDEALKDYAKKEYVEDLVSKIDISETVKEQLDEKANKTDIKLIYATGEDMQKMTSSESLVFCTVSTSSAPIYKANQLYYYDSSKNRFTAISGGSGTTTKETKTAVATLTVSSWPSKAEISNKQISIENASARITDIDFVNIDTIKILLNNNEIKYNLIKTNNIANISINNFIIDQSIARTNILKLSASAISEDDDFKYNITLPKDYSVSYYIPKIIELNSAEIFRNETLPRTNTIECSAGAVIVYYTTETINEFKMGGFPCEFTSGAEIKNINGVDVNYNTYTFNIASLAPGTSSVTIDY